MDCGACSLQICIVAAMQLLHTYAFQQRSLRGLNFKQRAWRACISTNLWQPAVCSQQQQCETVASRDHRAHDACVGLLDYCKAYNVCKELLHSAMSSLC